MRIELWDSKIESVSGIVFQEFWKGLVKDRVIQFG